MLDGRYSVLGVKGLTLSPPNISLVIVAKWLNFCFIWPQKAFSLSMWSAANFSWALRCRFWSKGFLLAWQPLRPWRFLKHAWLWTLLPVFHQLLFHRRPAFWWFLVDTWPSWPIFSQQQVIATIRKKTQAMTQLCHAVYTSKQLVAQLILEQFQSSYRSQVTFLTCSSKWSAFSDPCWTPLTFPL